MAVKGSCHCGKTRFRMAEAPTSVTSCNCSYCSKSGALWAYCDPEGLALLTPEEDRAEYRWGSKTVRHFFCDVCGCTTYGISPSWREDNTPDFSQMRLGVNARLLDGFDPETITIEKIDGRTLW